MRRSCGELCLLVLAGIAACLLSRPSSLSAHLGHPQAVLSGRYLKLDLAGDGVRVVASYTFDRGTAAELLPRFDIDGDRALSRAEGEDAIAYWAKHLEAELPVEVDGLAPEGGAWGEGTIAPLGPLRPETLTLELVYRFVPDGGEHRVVVRDRTPIDAPPTPTEVAFRARDGATLILSGVGPSPTRIDPGATYMAPAPSGEILLTAVATFPARGPEPSLLIAAGVTTALGIAIAIALRHARKKRPR